MPRNIIDMSGKVVLVTSPRMRSIANNNSPPILRSHKLGAFHA